MANLKGVETGLLVSTAIHDRKSGRRFLELLVDAAPEYAPERYNDYEPMKRIFDRAKLDEALECWGMSFFWRRNRPGVTGGALVGFRNTHDKVNVRLPVKMLSLTTMLRLFRAIDQSFGIDLAYIHIRSDVDTSDLDYYKKHLM